MPYYPQYTAYTPQYPTYSQTVYQQPYNGLVKVNGYESAMQYQLPPNSVSPVLLSATEDTFFIKRTDGSGVGTVEQYDFKPHQQPQPEPPAVTREEFDSLVQKVEALSKPRRAAKDAE